MPTFPLIKRLFTPHNNADTASLQHLTYSPDEWLVRFNTILSKHDIKLIALYGTCLGFYRDNQIIPGDTDADFGIIISDLTKLKSLVPNLLASGFFISGRGNYQLSFSMPNSKFYIDIWPFKPLKFPLNSLGHRWLCDHVYYKADFFSNPVAFKYNQCNYYLPNPCADYLEFVFGSDWRIPQSGYFSGPRGLLSQYINALFVDFPVPAAFSGCNDLGTYKPWVSKLLKTICPKAKITHLFNHPKTTNL